MTFEEDHTGPIVGKEYTVGPIKFVFDKPKEIGFEYRVARQYLENGEYGRVDVAYLETIGNNWTVVDSDGHPLGEPSLTYDGALRNWPRP